MGKVAKKSNQKCPFPYSKVEKCQPKGVLPKKGVLFLEKWHEKTIEEYPFPYSVADKEALIQKGKQRKKVKKRGGTLSGIVAEISNQKYPFS